MTPFQRYAWRRYGFVITGPRPDAVYDVRGTAYNCNVLVEKGGGCHPAGEHELRLWRALELLWNKTRRITR